MQQIREYLPNIYFTFGRSTLGVLFYELKGCVFDKYLDLSGFE